MKHLVLLVCSLWTFMACPYIVFSANPKSDKARIIFVAKENDRAKTYVCNLKRGNLASLKYELQRYNAGSANEIDVADEKGDLQGYVESIAVMGEKKKNNKKQKKAIHDDLIGNYEITDEKSLFDVKVKKLKKIEEREAKRDEEGNYKKYSEAKYRKKPNQLSEYFKFTKGKRLRNGSSFSNPSGGVVLIVKYKVSDGNTINTYVNVVDGYLKPNSTYNLKYHGTGSKRQYYLEYTTNK